VELVPLQDPDPVPTDLDLASAAERLGVHYQTAYQWVRNGLLPASRVRGRYQIAEGALEDFARRRDEPRPVRVRSEPRWDRAAARLEEHLLGGQEAEARSHVLELRDRGVPVTALIARLFVPALRAIGAGWEAGDVSIATEHRTTAMVDRLIGELFPSPRGRRRGRAVVAALGGDHHSLPTMMAAAALSEDHWHVEHLGSDVPADEVVRFAEEVAADLVVLTVTNPALQEAAAATSRRLEAADVPTLVGGPGRSLDELRAEARAQSPAARRAERRSGS
jgi:excisionase family DNA binding protein